MTTKPNDPKEPDTKEAITGVMTAFEEFKATNDARLIEIEKKGNADPLFDEKLSKIETTLSGYENFNQRLTQAESKNKALDDLQKQYDTLETVVRRTGTGDEQKQKSRVNDWAKAVVLAHTLGEPNLTEIQRKVLADVKAEYKALNIGNATDGGYLAPVEYVREIIKAVTEISPARSLARIRNTANKSIQVPKRTGQFAARRVGEQESKTETTGLKYGLEELTAPEMYALIDITNDMLEDSAFSMQMEISEESSEQFAVKEGQEFVSGTGVGEMEGILVNADVGEDVSGDAVALTNGDALITLKHNVKSGYARNASWIMNRSTIGAIRKLKTGTGDYIWRPGLNGTPNSIDGDPYVEFPDMPNVGAGLYPIAYGDFRRAYTILDRIAMEMLRDPYTQATGGKVRFIMRKRVGGQVVLAEAIRKMKISA